MKGYIFIYGVDGFGADTAPASEEGCYLDFNKAFEHLIKLTTECINSYDGSYDSYDFYEEGYGIDYYPEDDKELEKAFKEENWDRFDELIEKHKLTKIEDICKKLLNCEEPPFGFYTIEEIEIIE